jgi:hypothetical protein
MLLHILFIADWTTSQKWKQDLMESQENVTSI